MTMSDGEQNGESVAEMAEVSFRVPNREWLEERIEHMRYATVDDLVTEVLDHSVMALSRMNEMDDDEMDTITVSVPRDTVESLRFESSELDGKGGYGGEPDVEEILTHTFTLNYVREFET